MTRGEVDEEGNLLIEAVSLLVQRQHETETWVAEQISQAEERAVAAERRWDELEARLAGIEEHLTHLVHEVEPSRADAGTSERLKRLRQQLEGLKAGADAGLAARTPAVQDALAPGSGTWRETQVRASGPPPAAYIAPRGGVARAGAGRVSFLELLGDSREDRLGVLLMGAGGVALLYAVLTVLGIG